MDGVLADFVGGVYRDWDHIGHHKEMPLKSREELTSFWLHHDHPVHYGDPLHDLVNTKGFFASLDPIPGSLEALEELERIPHLVIRLCTAPLFGNPTCMDDKGAWVGWWLGREWQERIVMTKDKTLVRGDWLIDDKPKIEGQLERQWEHLVFPQPYNKVHWGDRRADGGWPEIVTAIQEACG